VADGGHPVPEEKILKRYAKSLANIPALIDVSESCIIVDNTDTPNIIYKKEGEESRITANRHWSEPQIRRLISPKESK
jgi:predicted ABC-type ATPase